MAKIEKELLDWQVGAARRRLPVMDAYFKANIGNPYHTTLESLNGMDSLVATFKVKRMFTRILVATLHRYDHTSSKERVSELTCYKGAKVDGLTDKELMEDICDYMGKLLAIEAWINDKLEKLIYSQKGNLEFYEILTGIDEYTKNEKAPDRRAGS